MAFGILINEPGKCIAHVAVVQIYILDGGKAEALNGRTQETRMVRGMRPVKSSRFYRVGELRLDFVFQTSRVH